MSDTVSLMSDTVSLKERIAMERAHLGEVRAQIAKSRQESMDRWNAQLRDVDRDIAALDAYEAAKTGKPTRLAAIGTRRARKDSRRDAILNALQASPVSMKRDALLDVLGVKGDKTGETSVSNALAAMLKSGQLAREDGRYHVPQEPLRQAAE